ncbi:MAG: RidA family protein [Tunicatimonas sp.]|uniref:RidA family protein n=1 Tax=Tunicatimonas sp. TaxID=1940096 RepID=UPI003C7408D2
MKLNTIIITLSSLVMNVGCQQDIITVETEKAYKTQHLGFSQANIYSGLLFTSGQVGWDTNYSLTGTESFEDQLNQTFNNLGAILEKGGSAFSDIILIRIYVKDLDQEKRAKVSDLIEKYYPDLYKPASSLIGVATLAREDLLVEIEIIARTKK